MFQFFVTPNQINGKSIIITGNDVNHIKQVLRMKPGEELAVSDGTTSNEYRCIIDEITDEEVRCQLIFIKAADTELSARVYLFQALPKADKMEQIIQKAVELGVYEIIPVAAKRSVVKLDEAKSCARLSRWQKIAEAAAKQSKRKVIPVIGSIMSFTQAAARAREMQVKMIPYEMAAGMSQTRELLESLKAGQDIAVFIGPEGGFDESEIRIAEQAGIIPITMGKRILRTETAGPTMLGWIMYQLECEAY